MSKHPKTELQCQFCAHVFTRTIRNPFAEITCPKCGEYDVLPTAFFGKETREQMKEREDEMFKEYN